MAAATKRPKLNGWLNRIRLVGVELEGGWDEPPKGETIIKDGSVKFATARPSPARMAIEQLLDTTARPARRPAPEPPAPVVGAPAIKGEIVSKPLPVEKIPGWVKHAYPKYVNETCGLHVHMSFHLKLNYSRLMTPEYTTWMVDKLRAWAETEKLPTDHPQWRRFNPDDSWTLQHCAHVYLGDSQSKISRKDYDSRGKPYSRYTFVNYCHNMQGENGPRGTVEVRGLSMPDDHATATRAIMTVLDATNEFLSKIKQKERSERVVVRSKVTADQVFRSFAA